MKSAKTKPRPAAKGALAGAYIEGVQRRLEKIGGDAGSLLKAASWCADALAGDHVVWVFGAGHSAMMAMEAYPRIGGVQGFMPMIEPGLLLFTNVVGSMGLEQTLTLERVDGYGRAIHNSYATEKGDVIIVYSSSGLEKLPLEIVTVARERGLKSIAVSSDEYSREAARQRGKKQRLADLADLFIDNLVPPGDASVSLPVSAGTTSPVSSVLNLVIMNCIAAETAGALLARGIRPRVFRSPHLGGSAANEFEALLNDYRNTMGRRWLRQSGARKKKA